MSCWFWFGDWAFVVPMTDSSEYSTASTATIKMDKFILWMRKINIDNETIQEGYNVQKEEYN